MSTDLPDRSVTDRDAPASHNGEKGTVVYECWNCSMHYSGERCPNFECEETGYDRRSFDAMSTAEVVERFGPPDIALLDAGDED